MSSASGAENFVKAIAKASVDEAVKNTVLEQGILIPEEDRKMIEDGIIGSLKSRKGISVEIPDSYYDDAQFTMDINVTGEQMNLSSANQTLQYVMNILAVNPGILTNPVTRGILFRMLELNGWSPIDLNIINQQADEMAKTMPQQQLTQGGSLPANLNQGAMQEPKML
jgi:hypothetical protein